MSLTLYLGKCLVNRYESAVYSLIGGGYLSSFRSRNRSAVQSAPCYVVRHGGALSCLVVPRFLKISLLKLLIPRQWMSASSLRVGCRPVGVKAFERDSGGSLSSEWAEVG